VVELTVAIAAAGPEQPLLATLRSLALETELPCEILVIDDGLRDASALAALLESDRRIRICRNDRSAGMVASLQRAVVESAKPLITLARSGEVVLPGALRALTDAMHESPGVGVAHAYWFPVDSLGRASRDVLRRHRMWLIEHLPATIDHRRALVVQGNILQGLPTFRRDLLAAAGGLEGASIDEAVYGATLRILSRADARLVARLLCGRPSPTALRREGGGFRRYVRQLRQCARVMRNGGAEYLRTRRYRFARLASLGLLRALATLLPREWLDDMRTGVQRLVHRARSTALLQAIARGPRPYGVFVWLVRRWSFDSLRPRRDRPRPINSERIAYVLWRYPSLTETFVRREVQALREAGLHLDVFALEPADPCLPDDPESPAGSVTYFGPAHAGRPPTKVREYFRRKPWTVVRLWLFVVHCQHRGDKRWWHDWDVLYVAVQLAAAAAERGITHLHSPWANHSALVAFVASRLLGVTYSVQARASEIHRREQAPMVALRVRFAEFLVTNSRYNERYLRSILVSSPDLPIHTIYNGVELFRFRPSADRLAGHGPLRVLSVGRLIESKGFRYLLHACRLLRDRGVEFSCEIIGGPQDPTDTITWIDLRKLHAGLGLESTVHFRGAMSFASVLSWYRQADIVVLPSVRARDGSHDVTPNTLIEAMAMQLPVVSTTTGAIPEIVDHEINGLLVPPNDAEALAGALERLLLDSELRRTLGAAARRKIEERFDIDRNVERRMALFWS
jgi:colanic acid/amylovoran biosynthesis glycosyltransferase